MFNFWWSAKWSQQKMLTEMQKKWKRPPKTSKKKCLFLDYIQLLMIGWAIRAKNVDQNIKKQKGPLSYHKNKMFIFGLCSTSDDWLSDPSKKLSTKIQKNEKGPLSHWKMKCSFLDYVQLLMIGQVIRVKNIERPSIKHWTKCKKLKKAF